MELISITIQYNEDGTASVGYVCSDGLTPEAGASACRFVASRFDGLAIDAEVERRLAEREKADEQPV